MDLDKKAKELSEQVKKLGVRRKAIKKVTPKKQSLDFVNNLTGITKQRTPDFVNKFVPTKVPEPDSPYTIASKLNTLKEAIEASVIKGLPTLDGVTEKIDKLKQRVDLNDMRWHGSGLSVITHDTTLTGTGTSGDPLSVVGGGGGNTGGLNTQVQFNDMNSFNGDAGLVYDKSITTLGVANVSSSLDPANSNDLTLQATYGSNVFIQTTNDPVVSGGQSGIIQITTEDTDSNNSGRIDIFTGTITGSGNASAGNISITGGTSLGNRQGALINLKPGHGGNTGASGTVNIIDPISSKKAILKTNPLTVDETYTFPDITGSFAILDGNQKIIGDSATPYLRLSTSNGTFLAYDATVITLGSSVAKLSVGGTVNASLDTSALTSSDKTFTFPNQSGIFSTVTSGSGAPASTPSALGQIYVDTAGSKVYASTGTASSADWKILN